MVIGSAGVLAPGRWRWLGALGWMLALMVGLVVLYNAVARVAAMVLAPGSADPAAWVRLTGAALGVGMILVAYRLAVAWAEKRTVFELSLHRAGRELVFGAMIGGGLIALIVGVQWAAGWVTIAPRPVESVALALRDALRSGVLEEMVLRLVVLRLLWVAFGAWPAIAGSALLFGALHMANPDASVFAAACLIAGEGVAIGLYILTGRIWASIAMHAAWNFTQGWVLGAAVSGTGEIAGGPLTTAPAEGASILLSGGSFGPEASLAAFAVSLVASVAMLGLAWRRGAMLASESPMPSVDTNARRKPA